MGDGELLANLQRRLKSEALSLNTEGDELQSIATSVKQCQNSVRNLMLDIRNLYHNIEKYDEKKLDSENAMLWDCELLSVCPFTRTEREGYEQLISLLQRDPRYIARIIVDSASGVKRKSMDKNTRENLEAVVRTTLFSVFGNAFHGSGEELVLNLMKATIGAAYAGSSRPSELFNNPLVKQMLILYTKRVGGKYLLSVLRGPLIKALQREDFDTELDPKKLFSNIEQAKSPEGAGLLEHNASNLFSVCTAIARNLYSNAVNMPYGIRWLAKEILIAGKRRFPDHQLDDTPLDLVRSLVLLRFVMPAVMNPELYGIITDFPITNDMKEKLATISNVIRNLSFGRGFPPTHPLAVMNAFITDHQQTMEDFFDTLLDVPEPKDYFVNSLGDACSPEVVISVNGLFQLHKLLVDCWNDESDGDGGSELRSILKTLPHPNDQKLPPDFRSDSKFLSLNELVVSVDDVFRDNVESEVKTKLRRLLCRIDFLFGPKSESVQSILEEQWVVRVFDDRKATESVVLMKQKVSKNSVQVALLSESIHMLKGETNLDQNQLLREMLEDCDARSGSLLLIAKRKQELLLCQERLQHYQDRLLEEKKLLIAYLESERFRPFIQSAEEEIKLFKTQFEKSNNKVRSVTAFLSKMRNQVHEFPPLQKASTQEIESALMRFENYFMSRIYDIAFPHSLQDHAIDNELSRKIDSLQDITASDLKVPEKYTSLGVTESAREELKNIHLYRTPRDKSQCIANCCGILYSFMMFTGDLMPSADDYVPILIFIILQTNPPRLQSNVQYVRDYFQVSNSESVDSDLKTEQWIMHFETAVEYIKTYSKADFKMA